MSLLGPPKHLCEVEQSSCSEVERHIQEDTPSHFVQVLPPLYATIEFESNPLDVIGQQIDCFFVGYCLRSSVVSNSFSFFRGQRAIVEVSVNTNCQVTFRVGVWVKSDPFVTFKLFRHQRQIHWMPPL